MDNLVVPAGQQVHNPGPGPFPLRDQSQVSQGNGESDVWVGRQDVRGRSTVLIEVTLRLELSRIVFPERAVERRFTVLLD